jgi:hypothetical protein
VALLTLGHCGPRIGGTCVIAVSVAVIAAAAAAIVVVVAAAAAAATS